MKKHRIIAAVLCIALSLSLLSACGGDNSSDPGSSSAKDPAVSSGSSGAAGGDGSVTLSKDYNLTMPFGGLSGALYSAAALVGEKWSAIPGVTAVAVEGGSESNVWVVAGGTDGQIGFTWLPWFYDAVEGKGMFEENGGPMNVKAIGNIMQGHGPMYIATAASGATDFTDLNGLNFLPGYSGAGYEYASRGLLEAAGMSYDSIKKAGGSVVFTNNSEAPTLMKDGHVDVFCTVLGYSPASSLMEIQSYMDFNFLTIPADVRAKFIEEHPGFYETTFDTSIYEGHSEVIDCIGYYATIICNGDLDDDLIYLLTKSYVEDCAADVASVDKTFALIENVENMIVGLEWDDIHPGAQRYYQEIGLGPNA